MNFVTDSLDENREYEADCDVMGSSACSKVVNTSLTIDQAGNTTISVSVTLMRSGWSKQLFA